MPGRSNASCPVKRECMGLKKSLTYREKWKFAGLLFALPSFIIVFVFIIIPIMMNIRYCMTDYNGISNTFHFIGFGNFLSIIKSDDFFIVLKNTLELAVIYVIGLNVLAIIIGVLIMQVGTRFGNFVKSLLFFPCLLSMVVVGFIWRLILNYDNGLLNTTLNNIGLGFLTQEWLGSKDLILPSVGVSIIWYALGYYLIIYYAGLMAIPQELYEAANVEGASWFKQFWHVTLPMLAPSTTINVVLSTVAILAAFDLPYVLTAGGGPGYNGTTLPIDIYRYAYNDLQQGKAFALSIILAVISIAIALLELKLLLKNEEVN